MKRNPRRRVPWYSLTPGDTVKLPLYEREKVPGQSCSIATAGLMWFKKNRPEYTITTRRTYASHHDERPAFVRMWVVLATEGEAQ
jgi:hypothetical protein